MAAPAVPTSGQPLELELEHELPLELEHELPLELEHELPEPPQPEPPPEQDPEEQDPDEQEPDEPDPPSLPPPQKLFSPHQSAATPRAAASAEENEDDGRVPRPRRRGRP